MGGQGDPHLVRIGLPPTGRTLNIGEQKGHQPRRRYPDGHPHRISHSMASHLQRRRMPLHALSALGTAGLTRPQRGGVYPLIRGPRLERPSVISLSAELRRYSRRPQLSRQPPSSANITNALRGGLLSQPTAPIATNAQVDSFASSRSGLPIPLAPQPYGP